MIIGLGIDIIEPARIHNGIDKYGEKFLQRLFTEPEITICQRYHHPAEHYAGKFAVKEAFMKAIGTGLTQNVTFRDIEVLNRDSGAPYIVIYLSIYLKEETLHEKRYFNFILFKESHIELLETIWGQNELRITYNLQKS